MLVYTYILNHTGGMSLSKGIVGLHTPGTLCSEPVLTSGAGSRQDATFEISLDMHNEATAVGE